MKMLLVSPHIKQWKVVEVSNDPDKQNHQYYGLIGCDLIDITYQKIGNKYYDIIFDDEFLLHEEEKLPSCITSEGYILIQGSFLICNYDEEENSGLESGLERSDIINIINHLHHVTLGNGKKTLVLQLSK